MKFPLAFRIFAVFNLIEFIILVLQALSLFSRSAGGAWLLTATCISACWLLISSIMWFFASKKSWSLLYLTSIILWILAGSVVAWGFDSNNVYTAGDRMVFAVYGGFCFIYSVFLIATMFFKPVMEWRKANGKPFDAVATSIFVVLIAAGLGFQYYVTNIKKEYLLLERLPVSRVVSETRVLVDLSQLTEMDAIVLTKDNNEAQMQARLYFSDVYATEEAASFLHQAEVTLRPFKSSELRDGESIDQKEGTVSLFATFPKVNARTVMIEFIDHNNEGQSDYQFTFLHSVGVLDKNLTAENFYWANEPSPLADEVGEEEYEDAGGNLVVFTDDDAETPNTLAPEVAKDLMDKLMTQLTSKEASFYFNTSQQRIVLNGVGLGRYLHFRSVPFDYFPGVINEVLPDRQIIAKAQNYDLNSGILVLTGLNLFQQDDGDSDLRFAHINPRMATWVSDNLPSPETKVLDKTAGEIYKGVFRRTLWTLAAAHEYLALDNRMESEAKLYREAINDGGDGFNGVNYLYEHFKPVDSSVMPFKKVSDQHPAGEGDYFYFTEQVAIGFWLRRKLDGSEEQLWNLTKKILDTYDQYPYEP